MPDLRTYNLFISHSWSYGDAYKKLVSFFEEFPNFNWTNYSVSEDDPIHDAPNASELYDAIKDQIRPVHCVLILAGVYSSYSSSIKKEIQISKNDFSKPVIAIEPWASEKTSAIVKQNADDIVRWQSSSIVRAIRNNAL